MESLSLNAATKNLVDNKEAEFGFSFWNATFSVLFLLLVWGFASKTFRENARKLAQWAAAHLVVYVLLGMEEKKNLSSKHVEKLPATRISRRGSEVSRPRKNFGLESKLESCSLERTIRKEAVTRLENTLIQATLDQATLESKTSRREKKTKSQKKAELLLDVFPRFPNMLTFTCEEKSSHDSDYSSSKDATPSDKPKDKKIPLRWTGLDVEEKPKTTQDPGSTPRNKKSVRRGKPCFKKVSEVHQRNLHGFDLDEDEPYVEEDYEAEPRADEVTTGDNFDGDEVGTLPRYLKLPKSAGRSVRLGVCGRSILEVPWEQIIAIHGNKVLKSVLPPSYPTDWCTALLRKARLS